MDTNFPATVVGVAGRKLQTARIALRLSTREVAANIAGQVSISHATIANYERGRTTPDLKMLSVLADFYQKPLRWFLESGPMLDGVRYRNLRSKVRASERQWYEANAQRWLEAYARIEERLDKHLVRKAPLVKVTSAETGAALAATVREVLDLSEHEPIHSVIEIL
jgi:transcriptional regulator with XRE-family HTH domain